MSLRVFDDFLDLPFHRVERSVRPVEDSIGSGPGDRLAEERQPSNPRAIHVNVFTFFFDLDYVSHALNQSRMAHDDGQLGKIFSHFADPFRTLVFSYAAVKQNM